MLANNLLCVLAQNLIPARNATEQDPRRVLGYEVLFRTKDLAQLLYHLNNQSVPPARIRELISAGGGIDWNSCLDELVRREEIDAEVAAALRSLE